MINFIPIQVRNWVIFLKICKNRDVKTELKCVYSEGKFYKFSQETPQNRLLFTNYIWRRKKLQNRAKKWIVFYLLKWREKIFSKQAPQKCHFHSYSSEEKKYKDWLEIIWKIFLFKWEVKIPVNEAGKISRQGYRHQPFENKFRLWLVFSLFRWLPIEKTFKKPLHLTFSHSYILRGLSKSDIFSRQGQYK